MIVFGFSKYNSLALKIKDQVQNHGVLIDSDLTFTSQIKTITKTAFCHLKNIARIECLVSQKDQEKVIHAFIYSRVDNYNGLLSGLSRKQHFQSAVAGPGKQSTQVKF